MKTHRQHSGHPNPDLNGSVPRSHQPRPRAPGPSHRGTAYKPNSPRPARPPGCLRGNPVQPAGRGHKDPGAPGRSAEHRPPTTRARFSPDGPGPPRGFFCKADARLVSHFPSRSGNPAEERVPKRGKKRGGGPAPGPRPGGHTLRGPRLPVLTKRKAEL